jgi:hypothetical protein
VRFGNFQQIETLNVGDREKRPRDVRISFNTRSSRDIAMRTSVSTMRVSEFDNPPVKRP